MQKWVLFVRLWAIIALLTFLFVLLRDLYFAMYHEPRSAAISRDLDMLYSGGGDDGAEGDENTDKDIVNKRDHIHRLRRSMGIGLDSLPTVRFDSTRKTSDENDDNGNDDSDYDNEKLVRERQRECLTFGSYISSVDEFVDCRSYCNVSDGVAYRYYDRLGLIVNGRKGRIGAYCVPTDAAVCNTNTSLAVYGKDGWRCVPQVRAFAGEGGNLIVVCNGRLLDRATGKIWNQHIDSTLAFDSIDELLPGTGEYRFVCPPERDSRGNKFIEAPFDRLLLLNNTCASLIPHADDSVRPNFQQNRCECGKYATYNEQLGTCVPQDPKVFSTDNDPFNSRTLESVLKSPFTRQCWEPWMTLSQARRLRDARALCGVEHSNADLGAAYPAFVRTRASLFDRLVPSPAAMLASAPSVGS